MKKTNTSGSCANNRSLIHKPASLPGRDIQYSKRVRHGCDTRHAQVLLLNRDAQPDQRYKRIWQRRVLLLLLAAMLFLMPGCGLLQRYLPDDTILPDPASLVTQTDTERDSDLSEPSSQAADDNGYTQAHTADDGETTTSDQPAGSATQAATQTVAETETTQTTSETREQTTGTLQPFSAQFYSDAEKMIQNQLTEKAREIKLDALFEQYRVTETEIDRVIENLFDVYQAVFLENPWYFYLNGSVQVNYTMLSGAQARVSGMTMQPQFWQFAINMSDTQLDALIKQVDQVVTQMTDEIRRQTSEPWQQLAALHQALIRHITYDTTENQEHNHAASALLDGLTLCQGYAQAFQMGAQRLGFDVVTITGEAGGQGHAWNMVRLDGQYYHVDVTHDDPVPDAGPDQPVRHLHFLRSDQMMRETHQWQADKVPVAGRDGAHYYRQTGRIADNRDALATLLSAQLNAHDLTSEPVFFLEILYTGADLPDRSAVDEMLQHVMRQQSITGQFYYRIQIAKSVVLVEVSIS